MLYETFHVLQAYAALYPEKISCLTRQEFELITATPKAKEGSTDGRTASFGFLSNASGPVRI